MDPIRQPGAKPFQAMVRNRGGQVSSPLQTPPHPRFPESRGKGTWQRLQFQTALNEVHDL